jgi:hypothetical protein
MVAHMLRKLDVLLGLAIGSLGFPCRFDDADF